MTTVNATRREKPFLLTVTPVKYSLTEGTDIPPPPESPVKAPPISTKGPFKAPPKTPEQRIPGAFPSSDSEDEAETAANRTMDPTSPVSAPYTSSPPTLRRPSGVRRMFSLTSLRQSFSSSRTSLALPRPSTDRPSTSRYDRPFTPSGESTISGTTMQSKSVKSKRSGWFKRKNSRYSLDSDRAQDAAVEDTRGGKRLKGAYNGPMLPDISELGGGDLDGGDLGWDATAFKTV